ncbi:hypothetical protein ElyMa_000563700 [Elysia marginata]|uniref:Ig-like domain-containing protein n=1 Tax=Elysia marginata TaxID=1093978 RepID=A0AAV4G3R1_9GAST|nr:hypothetical protein ElyMa_000563700 [Elysia marginata]
MGRITTNCTHLHPRLDSAEKTEIPKRWGGNPVKITNTPDYIHTTIPATASTPVYYSSQCSVTVPVQNLGEGTHSFIGYIYPDMTGVKNMVNGSPTDKTVTLNSVQIASSSSEVNLCDNNSQVQVTCEISRDNVSPAPTFSFSDDGPRSQGPQPGTNSSDGNSYQSQFSLSPDVGGQYQVTCRVTNSVNTTWQDKSTQITFNSISPSNIVTLAEGYTGDVTCRVEGGYPGAHSTQLKCGQLENTGDGNTATVIFTTDTLTRDLDETECTCTSQHGSGCYNNKETRFHLNVLLLLLVVVVVVVVVVVK